MTIRLVSLLCAGVLLIAACDRPTATDPIGGPADGPLFSSSSGNSIPVPPTNLGGGAVGFTSIGQVQPKKWAKIRVTGFVQLETNPALRDCDTVLKPPGSGSRAGPLGLPASPSQLKVSVSRSYNNTGLALTMDGDSSTAKTVLIFNPNATPEDIKASRTGVQGEKVCPSGTVPYYQMSGSQSGVVEELPDPKVNALNTVVASGDTVQFVASNIPTGINPMWVFQAGDTLATPKGYFGYSVDSRCSNKTTCSIPVATSGRIYLRLGNGTGGLVFYPSQIVWVGKNPSVKLNVECTPSVIPGGMTECTAGTSPSGQTIETIEWFTLADSLAEPCPGAGASCVVSVSDTIDVYVRARVGGLDQTTDARVLPATGGTTCGTGGSLRPDASVLFRVTSDACQPGTGWDGTSDAPNFPPPGYELWVKFYNKLNPEEWKMVWNRPYTLPYVAEATLLAEIWSMSAEDQPSGLDVPGKYNGPEDALRHAAWMAVLGNQIGTTWAAEWGNAHEFGSTDAEATAMDQHNNNVGRQIGAAHPNTVYAQRLWYDVYETYRQGGVLYWMDDRTKWRE